jgi:large subunit ribosomal protein L17
MNKKVFGRKLSRSRPAREALFASLIRSLIINGKIETTKAKAKAVQGQVEKFVTLAKKGSLADRRRILSTLDNADDALKALYNKVVPAFPTRTSGYTRIISLPNRHGDNAQMARMEWTEKMEEPKVEKKEKAPKAKPEKAKAKKKTK